ncbi:porin family protein [Fulvivirga ligni]|uniref:porin family protein n=1 Tax=Fulvivirga ligni TaxID=2904246 RepID=UPI001F3E5203|nr:porin family protein [Fulvivirga ligni]UII19531.1 PorT family protein [Fulvivirga ligni]
MKKITFLTLVCFFAALGARAQGVGLGIKAGANFANVDVGDVDTDSKTGYHFGAFVDLGLNENISIQPELLFSAQGTSIDDVDINMNYLTIPVLLKLKFAKVLNVHAGPQFGILSSAKYEDEDIKDSFKSADLSLALGAGVELPVGLVGGLRYNLGLNDINDGDDGFGVETKNRVMQIYVGWKLF